MSCEWIFDPPVKEKEFLAAAKKLGLEPDYTAEKATKTYYPIGSGGDDEGNWVWVHVGFETNINCTRFGRNNDDFVYDIADELGVNAWNEHDDEFHQILTEENDNDEHGAFVSISIEDLEQAASDIVEINLETGKMNTIKKDGKKLH